MKIKHPRSGEPQRCAKCHEVKLAEEFNTDLCKVNGLASWCKKCVSKPRKDRSKYPRSDEPRQCAKCRVVKPAEEFHTALNNLGGLRRTCKECRRAYGRGRTKYPRSEEPQQCTQCHKVKSAEKFHSEPQKQNGLRSWCRECVSDYNKDRPTYSRSKEPQKCAKCGTVKPAEEFTTSPSKRNGLAGMCKACIQVEGRRHRYGLTCETHLLMLASQNYECICGTPITISDPVDHCHDTGRIRDILCNNCNSVLGYTNDNPTTLRALADNLERHQKLEAQGVSQWGYVPTEEQ